MKKIYLILLIVLVALQLKAQLIRDLWGDVVPFSLSEKYKNRINTKELHSLVLPSYNNDSLCRIYNNGKGLDDLGNVYHAGFKVDNEIKSFKKYAKKIKLTEGTLWVFTIESPTAGALKIQIEDFRVPIGAYFCVYPGIIPYVMEDPDVLTFDNIPDKYLKNGFHKTIYDQKIVIEYFEPERVKEKIDFNINYIGYSFIGATKKSSEINSFNVAQ